MRISDWSSDVCSSDLRSSRGLGFAFKLQSPRENILEHLRRQPPRILVVAGTVVAIDQDAAVGERMLGEMSELEARRDAAACPHRRSEEHTSELQSLMRISYAVFCLKKKKYEHK